MKVNKFLKFCMISGLMIISNNVLPSFSNPKNTQELEQQFYIYKFNGGSMDVGQFCANMMQKTRDQNSLSSYNKTIKELNENLNKNIINAWGSIDTDALYAETKKEKIKELDEAKQRTQDEERRKQEEERREQETKQRNEQILKGQIEYIIDHPHDKYPFGETFSRNNEKKINAIKQQRALNERKQNAIKQQRALDERKKQEIMSQNILKGKKQTYEENIKKEKQTYEENIKKERQTYEDQLATHNKNFRVDFWDQILHFFGWR